MKLAIFVITVAVAAEAESGPLRLVAVFGIFVWGLLIGFNFAFLLAGSD